MKIALVSHVVPPSWSGTSMVIYRLLQDLDPERYCLISSQAGGIEGDPTEYQRTLPGRCYQIPAEFQLRRGFRFGGRHVDMALAMLQRARYVSSVVRRERCDAVVALTGNVLDLPTAYAAARLAGARFYPFIQDHYSKREYNDPTARAWAKRLEPRLLKGAARVIVANETMRDDLLKDFGVEAAVIHNSCDLSAYEAARPEPPGEADGGVSIVYTGDIYEAHYDAFKNLLTAIRMLDRPDVKLHLYTARPKEILDLEGISGPIVYHPHRQPSEIPGVQRGADMLFLPLAFDSPYPDVIRTSSTAKIGEYLAARRPVLVHAPADSFVSTYFREHGCGVVVDRLDPAFMAQSIERTLLDAEMRERLAARAWEQARADFDIVAARAKFLEVLSGRGV